MKILNDNLFYKGFLPGISSIMFIILINTYCNQPKVQSPRNKNGYDVIYYGDSMYHINFIIDSVEYIPDYD